MDGQGDDVADSKSQPREAGEAGGARGTGGAGDAFDLLGLPARFELTAAEVQRAYLARLGAVHPDRAEGEEALAARLNRAKQTLDDPELRAGALLARLGGPAAETDRSLPDGFLMKMMSVREEFEGAGEAERERLAAWAEGERRRHIERVKGLFKVSEGAGPAGEGRAALRSLRQELNAWRYIERMLEQVEGGGAGL